MTKKYKEGIYRKKFKNGKLGKYILLKHHKPRHENDSFEYEMYEGKRSNHPLIKKMCHFLELDLPYLTSLFNHSWYGEDFYNKYVFIKEGDIKEWKIIELERKKKKH